MAERYNPPSADDIAWAKAQGKWNREGYVKDAPINMRDPGAFWVERAQDGYYDDPSTMSFFESPSYYGSAAGYADAAKAAIASGSVYSSPGVAVTTPSTTPATPTTTPSTTPATPTTTPSTTPQMNIAEEMEKLKQAQLAQAMAGLDKSRSSALSNLSAERATIEPEYQKQKMQAGVTAKQTARYFDEYMAQRGGNQSGITGQGQLMNNMAYQNQKGALDQGEAMAISNNARRVADVNNAYESDLTGARAGIESQYLQNYLNQMNMDRAYNQQNYQFDTTTGLQQQQINNQVNQFAQSFGLSSQQLAETIKQNGIQNSFNDRQFAQSADQFAQQMGLSRDQFASQLDQWSKSFNQSNYQWEQSFNQSNNQWDQSFGLQQDQYNTAKDQWQQGFNQSNNQWDQSFGLQQDQFGLQQSQYNDNKTQQQWENEFRMKGFNAEQSYQQAQLALARQKSTSGSSGPSVTERNYIDKQNSQQAMAMSMQGLQSMASQGKTRSEILKFINSNAGDLQGNGVPVQDLYKWAEGNFKWDKKDGSWYDVTAKY